MIPSFRLGTCTLTRVELNPFDAVRIRTAWMCAQPPADDRIALAALTMCTSGHGIPRKPEGVSYEAWGADLEGAWLLATGAQARAIQALANTAIQAIPYEAIQELETMRDFFGLPKLGFGPVSPSSTEETPSSD